ncbi:MAG: class I SAM-dependent methyltransferase, partial [Akkermansiaceae bacterium]|nr:class I SAM-dependent methyltransferase [Akkermansiaceae bacterium]
MRVTERAHEMVRVVVQPGETVIDATIGNGHDTLFLARCVGSGGLVIGFDVQKDALEATRRRLVEAGIEEERARLLLEGHQRLEAEVEGPVAAVMFNL